MLSKSKLTENRKKKREKSRPMIQHTDRLDQNILWAESYWVKSFLEVDMVR
jgi:hypothetical protein